MFDIEDRLENTRKFDLSNGNTLHVTRTDPYGFWHFHLDKGQLPAAFQGQYSSWDAVLLDVQKYQTLRNLAAEEVKAPTKKA